MKEIEEIVKQEAKISNKKWYLKASFFLVSALVILIYVLAVKEALAKDDLLSDQVALVKIIVTLSVFAGLLIVGYFYNQKLSKKLDKLWEEKKKMI